MMSTSQSSSRNNDKLQFSTDKFANLFQSKINLKSFNNLKPHQAKTDDESCEFDLSYLSRCKFRLEKQQSDVATILFANQSAGKKRDYLDDSDDDCSEKCGLRTNKKPLLVRNPFLFQTMSPDDIVLSNLHRSGSGGYVGADDGVK